MEPRIVSFLVLDDDFFSFVATTGLIFPPHTHRLYTVHLEMLPLDQAAVLMSALQPLTASVSPAQAALLPLFEFKPLKLELPVSEFQAMMLSNTVSMSVPLSEFRPIPLSMVEQAALKLSLSQVDANRIPMLNIKKPRLPLV